MGECSLQYTVYKTGNILLFWHEANVFTLLNLKINLHDKCHKECDKYHQIWGNVSNFGHRLLSTFHKLNNCVKTHSF